MKRKSLIEVEEKKKTERRPRRPKVDLNLLSDAVQDGKLLVPVGGRVYFERIAPKGKMVIHTGTIRDVSEKGIVEIWDENADQFYSFSLLQKIPVVKFDKAQAEDADHNT